MLRNYIFFDSGLQTSRLAGHGFDPDAWRHEMSSDASSISAQGNLHTFLSGIFRNRHPLWIWFCESPYSKHGRILLFARRKNEKCTRNLKYMAKI